jgi:hypothetical protein
MKGFIEVDVLTDYPTNPSQKASCCLSVGAIVGISKGDDQSTYINLSHAIILRGQRIFLQVDRPYEEVIALIEAAQ